MTTRSARRLSARTAAAALIGVTTCCAFLALSGGVAKGDTTWTTSTGAPTTVTTVDDTFGPASVDPAPTTTAPTTTAPPTTEAPTTTVPPTTVPAPTTTVPDIFAPVEVIPLPVPTTIVVIPTTVPSPVTSVPSAPSPVPTLPTATTQPSNLGTLPTSATTTPTASVATTTPVTTATTVTGDRVDPTTTTAGAPVAEAAPSSGSTDAGHSRTPTVIGGKIEGSLASSGPVLEPFTVELPLPGSDSSISIEVRPSRLAAAWLLWVTVSLLVVAFWLPSPARRLATSSVPQRHRR